VNNSEALQLRAAIKLCPFEYPAEVHLKHFVKYHEHKVEVWALKGYTD